MTRLASISTLVLAAALGFAQTAPVTKTATTSTTTTSTTTASKPATKKKSGKHVKPAAVKVEEPPAPPPPPPTLAQQPPVAPTVTYRNGLLSIDAPNSTLGDILNGIRRATGAVIEGPSMVGDRVIVHLGPGQPRQVVAQLLGSSRFDFIVMGTPQRPDGVNRLVLMARQGGNQPQPVANNGGAPPYTAQPQRPAVAADDSDEEDQETPDRDENSYQPPSQPAQPQGSPAQAPQLPPDQMAPQQGQQQTQQDQNQNQDANPNAPKTPEQLYKELQNLERQRQQQTQPNQNNQEPPPPPQ